MSLHKVPVFLFLLVVGVMLVVPVSAFTLTSNATNDAVLMNGTDSAWATMRDGIGDSATNDPAATNPAGMYATTTSNVFNYNQRTIVAFNTSTLPDDAEIISANVTIYGKAKNWGLGYPTFHIVDATLANPMTVVAGDYNKTTFQDMASNNFTIAAYPYSYNTFMLNTAGISKITKNNTPFAFMFVTSYDMQIDNPTWASAQSSYFQFYSITFGGGNLTPYINVTYLPGHPDALTAITPTETDTTINWSWTNPAQADFNHTVIYKDGAWLKNVTNTTTFDLWESLQPETQYSFSSLTCDFDDDCYDWGNSTTVTLTDKTNLPGPMGTLAHNSSYLNITTYDNKNQTTHPSVIYTETAWNGYHYLMGFTPYWHSTESTENPSMRYSNDKVTWEQIAGQPDPIVPYNGAYHNADVNIVLNGSTLYLFYITGASAEDTYINYTTTTGGVTWTAAVKTDLVGASPSIIYNGTGWEAFVHSRTYPYPISHYTTADLATWTNTGLITGIDISPQVPWHSEVKFYDNQYQMLLADFAWTGLWYYNSSYGRHWTPSESNPVMSGSVGNWDARLYKSSFVERFNGFTVWYTGWTSVPDWNLGLTSFNETNIPVASFTTNTTSGLVPLGVAFTDTSTNTPTDWDWYINNVKFSDLQNPEYTFTEAGVYDVSLYAANGASGDWENKTDYITVTNWYDLQCQNQTGNISINLFSNSTTSLGWQWDDPVNITKISEDGLYVLTFDNSSDSFIGTGYPPESWHRLKIYNETDFGQLNCTTDAVPVTPTPIPIMPSTDVSVAPVNLLSYWPYVLLALGGIALMFKRF